MMKYRIDWAWLKGTVPGASGCIPRLGLEYKHKRPTAMHCEQIVVRDGAVCHRVLRDDSLKSGWTRPHSVTASAWKESP